MTEKMELLVHFIVSLALLIKPSGTKVVMAESMAMKQQLIVMNRGKSRSPKLTTSDRFLFGLLALFIDGKRLYKVAVIIKPATILTFHKALVKRKYSRLYSNKAKEKPGRKGQDQALIDLVIEIKQLNPSFGYGRSAMQSFEAFGIEISRFAVGRILRKNKHKQSPGGGPSWLTFIGHMKDSLWSVDLFRCESIGPASRALKSHWVMVVMDQFTRRIIGFAVHPGDCDGIAYCRLFNKIISGKKTPKYLSSDNDPLYLFHRWQANLRILMVDEIKGVPGNPTSHPFVERIIGTTRREYLDHMLFFNERDLQNKLDKFQAYYNDVRAHSSLAMKTPTAMAFSEEPDEKVVSIDHCRWKKHCSGLYELPMAA